MLRTGEARFKIVDVNINMNATVALLGNKIGSALNLDTKTTAKLSLLLAGNGIILNPRKRIGTVGVQDTSVITAKI